MKYGIVLFLLLLMSFTRSGGSQKAEEYAAKAAFIYNFTKFIDWPSANKNEFNIAILRDCAIINPLVEIAGQKKVNEKRIEVQTVRTEMPANPEILFIPSSVSTERAELAIRNYQNKHTLIITEKKGFLEYGSGINFLIRDEKIRFEINLKAIEQSGLTVSSQLLKLAVKVKQ